MRCRRPRRSSSCTVTASQERDDNVNNRDDSIEDGREDGTDGVDDAHEAGADSLQDGLDL